MLPTSKTKPVKDSFEAIEKYLKGQANYSVLPIT